MMLLNTSICTILYSICQTTKNVEHHTPYNMSVYIVAAKRTPFGAFGGKLKDVSATSLALHASKAAMASGNVKSDIIDSVIMGNVIQSSSDAAYLARHVGLKADVPFASTALTVNRLCGSGFQSVVSGAQEILLGESSVVLAGGTENMSQAPFAVRDMRFGHKFGASPKFEDTLWSGLTDEHIKLPMAITAENLADHYGISRSDCDNFALMSQQRWGNAQKAGKFNAEISPIKLKKETLDFDEHARPSSSIEKLSKLPAVFKKDGVVSAGNASGICDGAAALILASEDAVAKHGLVPLARIVSWGIAGVDPTIMGSGPVPAIKQALKVANLSLADMGLCEVNEAFAAQFLAVAKELGMDLAKSNVCGGAIAIGHPLGASGARILTHLAHRMKEDGHRYTIGSACIGGGQGIAVVLEKP